MRVLMLLAMAATVYGQATIKDVLTRLAAEAEAFQNMAPDLQGLEVLEQRALKPPPKFRFRAGKAATEASRPEWQTRTIVSAYGFAFIGADQAIHEIRQVISVDGRPVRGENDAQHVLAGLATASDNNSKIQSLKQLEKYGLRGAVTDFGQILLLFDRRSQERYEFTAPRAAGGTADILIRYKQLDGPAALTVVQGNSGDANALRIEGEIRIRRSEGMPFTVTMKAAGADRDQQYRQEATVEYAKSPFGIMMPVRVEQREFVGARAVSENKFTYADFHKFGKN